MAARTKLQSPSVEHSLALAIVAASTMPLLLLNDALEIVVASASFCGAYLIAPANLMGRTLFDVGEREWSDVPLQSLMTAMASGGPDIGAYQMALQKPGLESQRLVVNVNRVAYGPDEFRLLVSVEDVTAAWRNERDAETLAEKNAMLLSEVRHRVANSLQIIASVLMQNARLTDSEETRSHLNDAYQRVLSVAELQQQLVASTPNALHIRSYLTKLCETIAASMIVNHEATVLEVAAEDMFVDAGEALSLGLIVTELVINALKHAFPNGENGTITVRYRVDSNAWELSVEDNGVGIAADPSSARAGLGTNIVDALAKQLNARVVIDPIRPGARISIIGERTAIEPAVPNESLESGAATPIVA